MDSGKQLTQNRMFLTVVPIALDLRRPRQPSTPPSYLISLQQHELLCHHLGKCSTASAPLGPRQREQREGFAGAANLLDKMPKWGCALSSPSALSLRASVGEEGCRHNAADRRNAAMGSSRRTVLLGSVND